jgi:hypothetical protein
MDKGDVSMDRREILQGSVQGVAKVLHSMLGINAEMKESLGSMEGATRRKKVGCFPAGRKRDVVCKPAKSDNKEE